jgi:flagellar basal body-associated protein FliL
MDPFETEEERQGKTRRNAIIVIIIIVLVVVGGTGIYLWEMLRPLPQRPECAAIGWKAGIKENGIVTCYDNCGDNNIHNCRRIWVKR